MKISFNNGFTLSELNTTLLYYLFMMTLTIGILFGMLIGYMIGSILYTKGCIDAYKQCNPFSNFEIRDREVSLNPDANKYSNNYNGY